MFPIYQTLGFWFSIVLITITYSTAQKLAEQKVESFSECQTDRDCKPNSFCFGNDDVVKGRCKCEKEFLLDRNDTFYECFKAAKLGDACEKDLHCQVSGSLLAICNQFKICECNSKSHNFDGVCYEKARLGETCQTDKNCFLDDGTTNGTNGYCVYGHCQCNINEKSSEDKTRCLPTKSLGGICTSDEECSLATPNSKCFETCKCATQYTETRNNTACVKAAQKFDDPCEFDAQCSKFLLESICNDKKCGCINNFHGYGIRCVPTSKPGEKCTENAQCVYKTELNENVECKQGTCTCLYGQNTDGSCQIGKVVDDNNPNNSAKLVFSLISILYLQILIKLC